MLNRYVALDTETTGLDPNHDRIIEIGMVRVENESVIEHYQTLVQPHCKLSVMVKRITGIDEQMLKDAPGIEEVLPGVMEFIGPDPVMGHHVKFDCKFLEAALGQPLLNDFYDTLELARILLPAASSHRLSELCQFLSIELRTTHRALDDALYAHQLYTALAHKLNTLDASKLSYLAALLQQAGSSWANVVQSVAVGSGWTNPISRLDQEEEILPIAPMEDKGTGYVELNKLRHCFSTTGPLQQHMPGYGIREQQLKMAEQVAKTLNEEKVLLAEAGTGTGKSMAYLIPALLWAQSGGNRVIVSTRTIHLQEQLWEKEIPFLQRILDLHVPVALAKGRQNYLCLRKWRAVMADTIHAPKEALFYARILIWLGETRNGDKGELNLFGQEQDFWLSICGDSENCAGIKCPLFTGGCFINQARRITEAARLIITNHALLFADIKAENRVLPAYGPLIVDEAHHLEDAATEQLGVVVSKNDLGRWLNRAGKLLVKWQTLIPPSESQRWRDLCNQAKEERATVRQMLDVFFGFMRTAFSHRAMEEGRVTHRLKRDMHGQEKACLPVSEYENMHLHFRSLLGKYKELWELLLSWSVVDAVWESKLEEVERLWVEGKELLDQLAFAFFCEDDNYVYWLDITGNAESPNIVFNASPIKVDEIIYKSFFAESKPVIMTSATITVNGEFKYFMEAIGLTDIEEDRLIIEQADSPFHYDTQSMLCVVKGLPNQGECSDDCYVEALAPVLTHCIQVVGGKTLVLFTSHRLLRKTYAAVKGPLEEHDICLLGHNIDGGRWRLVEEFKNTPRAVIFGASSFWEGVDIPGEDLSCVIIVKLPFLSPAVPVVEARLEYLEKHGMNSFYHYSLPQAILRFKQGFGRLIRTESDRGAVIILDSRLLTKKYGRHFFHSLPVKNHFRGTGDMVVKKLQEWLSR